MAGHPRPARAPCHRQARHGWIPSLGYKPIDEFPAMRRRIDAAAEAAGRRPDQIRGILNLGIRIVSTPNPGGRRPGPGLPVAAGARSRSSRQSAHVYAMGRSSRVAGRSEIGRAETIEETGEMMAAVKRRSEADVTAHRAAAVSGRPITGASSASGWRVDGAGGGGKRADAGVVVHGPPDQPDRQGRQVADWDLHEVWAGGQGHARE